MIKLNGHFLNDVVAIDALKKLYNSSGMPSEAAHRVGRIFERVMREMKVVGEKALSIHKKYCLIDPTGMPSGISEGKLEFNDPKDENEKKHDEEFINLLNVEFEEKVHPISLKDLGTILSPKEIDSLKSIIEY